VLLTSLAEDQKATVLQLSAAAVEIKVTHEAAYV
jgi:hypothetical protein